VLIYAQGSRGSGLATLGLLWKGEPLDSGNTAMRRLIKPISTLLLVAIPMAVVDPALAETRTARDGEAVIEYQIDGTGPAVLMIASLGRPATDFDELSASLVAAGYSTIRPQPRGIGGSTGPMSGLSLRDLAADAMAAADDGPIIVIGHDFGQRVARMVAALYPDRVESVVMLGAGGKVPMLPGAGEALGAVFDATLPPDKHMDAVRFSFFAPGNDPSVWRDGWYPAVAQMQTAAAKTSRVEDWWGAGKARLLVVVGLQDVVAPPENGRLIKDEFGDRVTLQEIDGAGHAMLPERPKEVASAVLNFLKPQSK
jgi:pimeloyl-ACP methyl ester carboxylesterase